MPKYRDSYYQYNHQIHSNHVIYSNWFNDMPIPNPDTNISASNNNNSLTNTDSTSTSNNGNSNLNSKYWDFFDTNALNQDFDLFNNIIVEPNGNLIFNKKNFNSNARVTEPDYNNDDDMNTLSDETDINCNGNNNDPDNSDNDVIVGSLFNIDTIERIKTFISSWEYTNNI
ncbi:hypothetical protein KAFR_0G02640 [Kazachstania africana CBS 2517]|uniref:Anaphase-promoting complex subunit 13 n=1 Tax=Kazachstania africana (strain ATCC 22294 / BCRC 22015 / CBS 2517 / CECT 1963 / NBRC 1671 / NRRL Y-8276) TaxID=1071382 RepID=H2AY45_KAZAF|nr:hypothetical protein KAFR_0G02640 [Kazachstania africana CBS 2517]CCF59295.1 hypothetical protein KAFR_0G02640 [Kazachstania africana CBS 2517]